MKGAAIGNPTGGAIAGVAKVAKSAVRKAITEKKDQGQIPQEKKDLIKQQLAKAVSQNK